MKRVYLVPLAIIALTIPAMVSAAGVTFNYSTGAFDFTNAEIDTGYIGLSFSGNQLTVHVSSAGSISSLPAILVQGMGPTTLYNGTDVYPGFGGLGDVETYGTAGSEGFQVVHENVLVSSVAADYVSAMTGMGFTAKQLDTGTANVIAYDFTNAGMTVHGVFHQSGNDVTAYLASGA
ncbi:MAG: hypothetical protein P8Z81_03590 [Deinococcales bacterium]